MLSFSRIIALCSKRATSPNLLPPFLGTSWPMACQWDWTMCRYPVIQPECTNTLESAPWDLSFCCFYLDGNALHLLPLPSSASCIPSQILFPYKFSMYKSIWVCFQGNHSARVDCIPVGPERDFCISLFYKRMIEDSYSDHNQLAF